MQHYLKTIIISSFFIAGFAHSQNMNNITISRDANNIPPNINNRFQGNVDSANINIPQNIKRGQSGSDSIPSMVHTQRTQNDNRPTSNTPSDKNLPVVTALDCKKNNITPDQMEALSQQYINELANFASKNNLIGVTLEEKENLQQGIVSTSFIYSKLPQTLKCHTIRVLSPNSVVTMEYSIYRINVYVDENKKIVKFAIG